MATDLRRVLANGLSFACHVRGDGPRLALLLHGFPDDPGSMLPLAERLAAADFTVVAPFMRGYGETDRPRDGDCSASALARDVVGLIEAFGRRDALVVGHDWGAVAGYAAAVLEPGRVARLVALSVPPARTLLRNLARSPAQLRRSAYVALFQARWLAEHVVRRDDFAFVERLWRAWSPGLTPPPGRLAEVKRALAAPGALEAALGYYRALGRPGLSGGVGASWRLLLGRVGVPTLVVAGADDGCVGPGCYAGLDDAFTAPRRFELLPGVGHFLSLEATDALADLVLGFSDRASSRRRR